MSLKAHLGNKYLPYGILAVVVLQLLFTCAWPFQAMFGDESIPLRVWPWLIAGGLVFFLVVEAEKGRHPLIGVVAERRHGSGGWDLSAPAAPGLLALSGGCQSNLKGPGYSPTAPVSARHNTVASTRDSSVYRAEPQRGPIGRMLTRLASFPTVRPKVQGRNRGWNDARF